MARITGVSSAQAGLQVKIAYYFTRRAIGKLTGRQTERMIEPLEIYAHVPVLFKGYAKFEQATAKLHRLDKRLHALAELKAATLTHAEAESVFQMVARYQPDRSDQAGSSALSVLPLREQVHEALSLLTVPAAPRLIATVHEAFFAVTFPIAALVRMF